MKRKPETEDEDWDFPLDPLTEATLLPEVYTQSLFFRVARRREEYFSDVEAISQIYDIENVPTPRVVDHARAISDTPTQPRITPVEEQPTSPVLLACSYLRRSSNFSYYVEKCAARIFPRNMRNFLARLCRAVLRRGRAKALKKCWLLLRSLQNTRKLPAASPDW
jgi:hypothetical protein